MRFLLIAVSALSLYAQQTGNTFAPSQSAQPNNPPAGGLTVANPFSEYFDSTTQTAQWATTGTNCGTDAYTANQTALAWYQASGTQTKPGFNYYSNGHGGCSTNPSVFAPGGSGSTGAGTFDLKWDSGFTAGNLTLPAVGSFGAGFYSTYGGWAGVSTDPVGSMTGTTISLLCSTEQDGPTCGVFQGIPFYFNACAYITNSTTLTRTGSGDPFVAGLVNQQFFITDYLATGLTYHGPYTVTAQTSTTLTVSPAMSWSGISFGIAQIGTITGWAELSNFNQFVTGQGYGGTTIPKNPNPVVWWPYDGPLANLPIFTFEIYRDSSNNATFNVYAPTLQNGTSPWLTWSVNLVSGITYLGSQTSAFSLGYINVANKNANHTNWLGGVTTSSNPSSSTALSGWFGNFRGYGVVTGTLPTVTGVVPTASGANFTSTTGVTINGANFNTSSTLHIGLGTSASTAVATTYVSSSQLTATLPTQSANGCLYGASATHTIFEASDATPCFYEFKVIDATGVEARLPLGINYESAVVNRIDPQEFTTGDTLTVTGSGFSSGGSMTIGGHTCGTYTYIDAAHFTCVVPSGITASSPPATVIVSNNSGSIFNSSVNSGTFNGTNPTQLAAGLSAHPYFLGTGTATTLSGIQTAFNSAITAGSGIAWDYAQNAVNTVANQPLNWSANVGMQSQSYQNSPILNTPAGLVCTYIANTPCYYPIRVQQMFDYAWHYLLAGDSPSLAQVTTLLPYHTNQIYSVDQMSTNTNLVASFHAEDAGSLAQLYDLMWPTWTTAQRTAILGYLNYYDGLCTYEHTGSSFFWIGGGSTYSNNTNNWGAISNGVCGTIHLALYGENPQESTRITSNDTTLTNYETSVWYSDGVPQEGGQYAALGLGYYLPYAKLRYNTTQVFTGTGNDGGLLAKTNIVAWATNWAPSQMGAGGWATTGTSGSCPDLAPFIFSDNEPEHPGVGNLAISALIGSGTPQLIAQDDCMQHVTAANNYYLGYMDIQGAAGAFWPFAWRYIYDSGAFTPISITGLPAYFNTGQSGCPSGCTNATASNYVVMRSDASALPPDGEVMVRGKNFFGPHNHPDEGSVTARFSSEEFIIDCGYFCWGASGAPNNLVHNYLNLNGASLSQGNGTAKLDTTNSSCGRNTSTYKAGCWDTTSAFNILTGSGTATSSGSTLTNSSGTSFTNAWIGMIIVYNGSPYQVATVPNSTTLTTTTSIGTNASPLAWSVTGVTTARRTTVLYSTQNGGTGAYHARALVLLDDVLFGNANSVNSVNLFNTTKGVATYCPSGCGSTTTTYGYTLTGTNTNVNVEFYGPTLSGFPSKTPWYFCSGSTSNAGCKSNGAAGAGGSWVYNQLTGTSWSGGSGSGTNTNVNGVFNQMKATWATGTNTNANPLVTVIYPTSPTGNITVTSVTNVAGTLTITFSDASTIVFVSTAGGPWILQ